MLELVNFSNLSDEIEHVLGGSTACLPSFFARHGLDGLEFTLYEDWNPVQFPSAWIHGVHLRFWLDWLDFWYGNRAALTAAYGSEAAWQASFGRTREEWIAFWRRHVREAVRTGARHAYGSAEVIEATLELVNMVMNVLPEDCLLLYENLWWPGLTLLNPKLADHLLSGTHHQRTGLLLDTGHLMNTSTNLATEDEAVRYVRRVVRGLGGLRTSIYGMHLHRSLSGAFVRRRMAEVEREDLQPRGFSEVFDYISHVDEHQPFRTAAVQALVEDVQPKFLVHEFIQDSMEDWEQKVHVQRHALGWESDAEDGQKGKTSR
ncbi:xylose isomerase [uncultured Selenomonas sp.]|uniref:xylose isomerase n=1 Tax=uncultured Selenomonas sp. TaxID=159275 RepID=UPI0025E56AD2|nr:xylose isomerase [uncultured Selenomonas sp.]